MLFSFTLNIRRQKHIALFCLLKANNEVQNVNSNNHYFKLSKHKIIKWQFFRQSTYKATL